MCWSTLQLGVKWPSLRSWFPLCWEESSCSRWRSLIILASCSQVREDQTMRSTGKLVPCSLLLCQMREKRELSQIEKLSIYMSIFIPIPTYCRELWVMTKRTRSRIQAAAVPMHREKPAEVAHASGPDASWTLCCGGVVATPLWAGTSGKPWRDYIS